MAIVLPPILYPWFLYAIPLVLIILILIIFLDFVKITDSDSSELKRANFKRRITRILVLFSRTAIIVCLLIALSTPYYEKRLEFDGNPTVFILEDNSSSTAIFKNSLNKDLIDELGALLPVRVTSIGSEVRSDIGDGIMKNLDVDRNLLVITDGRSNSGESLDEVAFLAADLNATLNFVEMVPDPNKGDASIMITGPSKTVASVKNTFTAFIDKESMEDVLVNVVIDNKTIYHERTDKGTIQFSHTFSEGEHEIIAEILDVDHFSKNNIYYKTIHTVNKPSVLMVSKAETPLESIFTELYDVNITTSIPDDLSGYYAIIFNDLAASEIGDIEKITEFTTDGGGMFVVGGYNSFDYGGYEKSELETLLPVKVGDADEEAGRINVVIVLDISTGTIKRLMERDAHDPYIYFKQQKAQTISVIDSLSPFNNVGYVAFATDPYLVSAMDKKQNHYDDMVERIARLQTPALYSSSGYSYLIHGLEVAYDLLKAEAGSKNVIIVSDGKVSEDIDVDIDQITKMLDVGIKTYVLTPFAPDWMIHRRNLQRMADAGAGVLLEPNQSQRLRLVFRPENKPAGGDGSDAGFPVSVFNSNHFITRGVGINFVTIGSFNSVNAKFNAQVLLASESGVPALSIWRRGLGRVATFTVFEPNYGLGDFMKEGNSQVITRTMNWLIGDPERLSDYFFTIEDSRINTPTDIYVKINAFPKAESLSFYKIGEDRYTASFTPDNIGFNNMLNSVYAVNYEEEFEDLGFNDNLNEIAAMTGGKVFGVHDAEEIAEFVKNISKRVKVDKIHMRAPFILIALILFLIEVCIRRVVQNWLGG